MSQVVLLAAVLVLAATIVWQNERQYRERREIAKQIEGLLQRIQAPQAAVAAHYYEQGDVHTPPAIRTDDEPGADEDWELARVDKEDLARRAAEEELSRG